MPSKNLEVRTRDGVCSAYASHPAASGKLPAVLLYVDGMGLRDSLREIADRIASNGYYVLLPDLFYRTPGQIPEPAAFFNDPEVRANFMKNIVPTVPPKAIMSDTDAFLDHFASQPNVKGDRIGITGYCMGGRLSVYAAGHYGDRVAAAAAFHPGGLATDSPDSPHLLAPAITAGLYVGAAMEDRSFDDAQKARFSAALDQAGVDYEMETYPARHGWVPRDTPVHDPVQAERHFDNLLGLFRSRLGAGTA
jgi:carboxymethylenebutenolidase